MLQILGPSPRLPPVPASLQAHGFVAGKCRDQETGKGLRELTTDEFIRMIEYRNRT